ncbi:MAG: tetratricopeptide (TPR) repeat protein [Verrucomicrobiales bacterium]|jgi:tetratricopeptide (TPR) repeat protein
MIVKRLGFIFIIVSSCWLAVGSALSQVEDDPEFKAALQALQDDLPSVAADKFKRLYADPNSTDAERALIGQRLLESLGRAGRAIELLSRSHDDAVANHSATPFWKAVALVRLERLADAEQLLAPFGDFPEDPLFFQAVMTRANLLVALKKPAEARESLNSLLENLPSDAVRRSVVLKAAEASLLAGDTAAAEETLGPLLELRMGKPDPEIDYLLARVALAEERFGAAEPGFRKLIEGQNQQIGDGARLGLADLLAARGRPDDAVDELVKFANQRPESPQLRAVFQRLEQLDFLSRERASAILKTWAEDEHRERRAFAEFYLARAEKRSGGVEAVIEPLEMFRDEFGGHFLLPVAMLELGSAYVEVGKPEEAVEILKPLRKADPGPELGRAIAFLQAQAQFEAGEFDKATEQFAAVATDEPNAAFNRAVAALYAENVEVFQLELQRFGLQPDGAEMEADLMLERGLFHAAQGDRSALISLKEFMRLFPEHERAAEAQLVIAELLLLDFPPQPVAAQAALESARSSGLPEELEEQADYVNFWIAAIGEELEPMVEAANAFFESWEASPRRGEIRLRLGEIYFARKDYPNAQNHFELIVEESPDDPNAEIALFLAGKSASLSMSEAGLDRAIKHWGIVFDQKGPLAYEALRQQAVAKLKQNQPDQALRVLEDVLAAKGEIDEAVELAALMNVGQAYFLKSGDHELPIQMLVAAIDVYNQIITRPSVTRFWKNQAAVRKGRCLELIEDEDLALETYYNVVSRSPVADLNENEAAEYTWFYRAGFAAVSLLQGREEWRAAVKMSDRLASTSGSRASEAFEMAKKLRLEHFIWDEAAK